MLAAHLRPGVMTPEYGIRWSVFRARFFSFPCFLHPDFVGMAAIFVWFFRLKPPLPAALVFANRHPARGATYSLFPPPFFRRSQTPHWGFDRSPALSVNSAFSLILISTVPGHSI